LQVQGKQTIGFYSVKGTHHEMLRYPVPYMALVKNALDSLKYKMKDQQQSPQKELKAA